MTQITKYKGPVKKLSLRLELPDWEILDRNATRLNTVTDQIQKAVKELIKKEGLK